MWDDLVRSGLRGRGGTALVALAFLLIPSIPASVWSVGPTGSSSHSWLPGPTVPTGASALLRAQEPGSPQELDSDQEPESVQEMGESPAFQELPGPGEQSSDSLRALGGDRVPLHPEAEEAIGRLRSPWCPGFMLEVCPSPEADAFRDTLRMLAQEGIEADSLVEWAIARYGDEWRALPQARGTGLLAWVIPPVVLILGAGLVVVVLRRLRSSSEGYRPGSAPELSEDEERQIEEALAELDWEGR